MSEIEINKEEKDLLNKEISHEDVTEPSEELANEKAKGIGWPQFLLFFVYFLGLSVVIGFIIGIYDIFAEKGLVDLIFTGYSALLVDTLIFLIVFLSFRRVREFVLQSFNLAPLRSLRTYIYIVVGFLTFAITQYFLIGVWGIDDASGQASDLGADTLGNWFSYALFYLAIVILTPIKEELIFRGLIHRFMEVRHHFWLGIIASSLIFGLLHFGFPISATIMGVVLVVLYKLTNSIMPSILLHVTWNLMGVIGLTLG